MANNNQKPRLIRPSYAAAWASCQRRAWLNMHNPADHEADAFTRLLFDAGLQHERKVLAQLQTLYGDVHHAYSHEQTTLLMQQGVSVIYQARLVNDELGVAGSPDFLIRHDNGQYQPADAKLTQKESKKALLIQLGLYRRLLDTDLPVIVFLGNHCTALLGEEVDEPVSEFLEDMQRLRNQTEQPDVRYSHSKCRICPYFVYCRPEFERQQDISLLHGIHGRAAEQLSGMGIGTIAQLAAQEPANLPDVQHLSGLKRKRRAITQARAFLHDTVYPLSPVELPEGTWIHFDIEDNPLTPENDRHVYLWGMLLPPYTRDDFDYVWTDHENEDYDGWLAFLEKMELYRALHAPVILAHYSNHERATIQKYAQRYNMTGHATVQWLLNRQQDGENVMFDMQKAVQDNLVLPLQSYGLKDICKHPKLVNFQWENKESGSQWSVVQFNRFLIEEDTSERQRLKKDILGYNRDDVMATRQLEQWLRLHFME